MEKLSKVFLSTTWRLRKNFVLLLMECSTPIVSFEIFMDNYFTSFRLLTYLGVNNIRATRVLNKNRLRKCTITGDKQLQERKRFLFFTVMVAWGGDVSLSHKEYQNALNYYRQNLVICSYIGVKILFTVIYIVDYNESFPWEAKKRSLWQVESWRAFKESKRKR